MLKGLYTATSAMIAQERRTEMLSNNIANANTPGYKADEGAMRAFPEMLLSRMESGRFQTSSGKSFSIPQQTPIGGINTGTYMQELIPQFTQGTLKTTDQTTDVALVENNVPMNPETNKKAALFYAVNTQNGVRYTKSSSFTLNEQKQLNINGRALLSVTGQPITVQSENFKVNADGIVSENGRNLGQIDVRVAMDTRNLAREGNDLYRTANNQPLPSAVNNGQMSYTLSQGVSELSNVDVTKSYTEMTTAYRSFETNQKVVQAYDKSLEKAVNEIGRVY
ncbi:flagellar hook-basal body protein [Bacillus sp. Bos-x628]|uniref:flagellar hook-basal body protein n=1 Tax=Bacillus maqinnsis TaxID=3229854 RepID=UPI00338F9021